MQKNNIQIAIISSSFHHDITKLLITNCVGTLAQAGISTKQMKLVSVPGALEIPLVAKRLAKQNKYSAIIALGVIHKGETFHFEQVANECVRGCMQVGYDHQIPVIYEVLAVYNLDDAIERANGIKYNRGKEAAEAALKMIDILKKI